MRTCSKIFGAVGSVALILASIVGGLGVTARPSAAQGAASPPVTYGTAQRTATIDVANLPGPSAPAPSVRPPAHSRSESQLQGGKAVANAGHAGRRSGIVTPTTTNPVEAPAAGVATINGFPGISAATAGAFPPDTQVAVGPTDVVEMTNGELEVLSTTGTVLEPRSLASFFGTPSGFEPSDPRILYDGPSGRFFASAFNFDPSINASEVVAAVSATSDPSNGWFLYAITTTTDVVTDQPVLGISADKVVLSWNDFSGTTGAFAGSETWVLQESDMLTGSSLQFARLGPDPTRFRIVPVQNLTPSTTAFAVYNNSCSSTASCTTRSPAIGVAAITGRPALGDVTWTEADPAIMPTSVPPGALQPNGVAPIDTGDDRFQTAVWQNGTLWVSGDDGCVPAGDTTTRACSRLIEVNTATSSVVQDADLGSIGQYQYYPAVGLDGNGDLFVVQTLSSDSLFPSVVAADQPAGSTSFASGTLIGGSANYIQLDQTGRNRWGDYSSAAMDPANPDEMFLAGEYMISGVPENDWQTLVAQVTLSAAGT